jgi:hypothetical protein
MFLAEMQKGSLFNYLTIVGVMLEGPDAPFYPSGRSIWRWGGHFLFFVLSNAFGLQ